MQPRYQVFVSSTFRDLREERQAAHDAILELNHFPAGMETFPAADATPWDLIRSIIEDSDYYVLIIGGRYGTTGPEGISYTEMEFNLAVELNKPVLAFLHGAPEEITAGRSEMEPEARRRLEAFRARVAERHCKSWRTSAELKTAVLLALIHAIRTKPAAGWVRNEGLETQELLKRLATLQARFDSLEEEATALRRLVAVGSDEQKYQDLEEAFQVAFTIGSAGEAHEVGISWSDMFFGLADEMLIPCPEERLKVALNSMIFETIAGTELARDVIQRMPNVDRVRTRIDVKDESLKAVARQLMAKGLIEPQVVSPQYRRDSGPDFVFGGPVVVQVRCWVLTAAGRSRYLSKVAVLASEGR